MSRVTRDRWITAALAGALVSWWVGGLAYRKVFDEPYPALAMPDFPADRSFPEPQTQRLRLELRATLADGREELYTPRKLLRGVSGEGRRRVMERMLKIDRRVSPPAVRALEDDAGAWLAARVAEREGIDLGAVRAVAAAVVEDAYDLHASPPRVGSRRLSERLLFEAGEPRGP